LGGIGIEKEEAMAKLPAAYTQFSRRFPQVAKLHERLGEAAAGSGPLDERTAHLVKLGMAMGVRSEGAVHSHVRRALAAGATAAQVRHVAALAVATLGFPAAAAAFTWIEDILGKR
jgi:alkylhydroperoxidase/carboxymuconolactone decarboxylase family protein YurZ